MGIDVMRHRRLQIPTTVVKKKTAENSAGFGNIRGGKQLTFRVKTLNLHSNDLRRGGNYLKESMGHIWNFYREWYVKQVARASDRGGHNCN